MPFVVDFHCHVFPHHFSNRLSKLKIESLSNFSSMRGVSQFRKQARGWIKPVSASAHRLQTTVRHLPQVIRNQVDQFCGILSLPGLLIESNLEDLLEAMAESKINATLVIAHPPIIENDFVLEISKKYPAFIPVVTIPKGTKKPGSLLKTYTGKGAQLLNIHPAFDGEGAESRRYHSLLQAASELNMPVIIHTGCFNTHLLYKNPSYGDAKKYTQWFSEYSKIQFILAHMNFHDPHAALDLCAQYNNVFVDTSWQPSEMIGEAVRRIGAERVLFGTDWPFMGNNMGVGRKRVLECIEIGLLNESQAKLILGENAAKLLGISMHAY